MKKVFGVVTHLAGNASKAIDSSALDGLVVTNTLPVESALSNRVKVLSIAREISEIISEIEGLNRGGGDCERRVTQ